MFSALFGLVSASPVLFGAAGAGVALFVAVGLLGGWALVLNRYGIGALAGFVGLLVGVAAWQARDARLMAEGAAQLALANTQAHAARADLIAGWEIERQMLQNDGEQKTKAAVDKIEETYKGRLRRVSQNADRKCVVPAGFVYDHDADLAAAAGRPEVPPSATDDDRDSRIPLSVVGKTVGRNYTELGKCAVRLERCEQTRYDACLAWDKKFGTRSGCTR
jgi:hypothetical protein